MAKAMENAIWPATTVPDGGKELISRFFELIDLPDPASGRGLAEDIFTEKGVFIAGSNRWEGSEGTSSSVRYTTIESLYQCRNQQLPNQEIMPGM